MPSPETFRESLVRFGIPAEEIARIDRGYETVTGKSTKSKRAAFFTHAVEMLEQSSQPAIVRELMEWNACCKSGAREKASKQFARDNLALSLQEKLEKISTVPYMGKPVLESDGTLTLHAVSWLDGDSYRCACSQFSGLKRTQPVGKSYCLCCAGHFKYHYEIMLGARLQTLEVVSSPLESLGKKPCVIRYAIEQEEDDACLQK